MSKTAISTFLPVYNEQDSIEKTVRDAKSVLKKAKLKWEILIVDDGSTDKSLKISKQIAQKDSNVRVISQHNQGYGGAIKTGFSNSKNDLIAYIDSDGQFDFQELPQFLEAAKTADAVWGFRIKRRDPLVRSILSRTWSISLLFLFGLKLKDVNCGFKLIKKSAYQRILPLNSNRGGMINAELAIKLQQKNLKIAEVGVQHFPRLSGTPTGANLSVAIHSYVDLIKLWLG